MKRILIIVIQLFLVSIPCKVFPQFTMEFGNISAEELSNKPYKPDPGADAIILSENGIATMNLGNEFYIQYEKDVRIRIVNSNGFDYADVEVPFSAEDDLIGYKASSFNLRNGVKTETKIQKKDFIIEKTTKYRKTLKFNFPDVSEGTVIEYSFLMRKKNEALSILIPWDFQKTIPVVRSSLITVYPEFFVYKNNISGNPLIVMRESATKDQSLGGERVKVITTRWSASNVPAFRMEPFAKNIRDNQTRIDFELESVKFPHSSVEDISPTYEKLTEKLLERDDFGHALAGTSFLKKAAGEITSGLTDESAKVRAIYKYVSEKMLWNGEEDFTSSQNLRKAFGTLKGNSADVNMILIGMLRAVNIKAEPVILSTRSNGSISQLSAMIQQFNYLVANVTIDGESVLIDATDPLRPYYMLPFDCLNGTGRQINKYDSRFIDLANSETNTYNTDLDFTLMPDGEVHGTLTRRNHGYRALEIRKQVKLEGEEGYASMIKASFSDAAIRDFVIKNISEQDSDVIENFSVLMNESAIRAGERLIFNPYFSFSLKANPFSSPDRSFPVDLGCPRNESFTLRLKIPDGYFIEEAPADLSYNLEKDSGKYRFSLKADEKGILVTSSMLITKTSFSPIEYKNLRDFFAKMLESQTRMIVLKKKI